MILAVALALVMPVSGDWLERIYVAPPEIGAKVLLRHLDADKKKKAEQLEEAFRLAGQARMSYPLMAQAPPDSLAGKQMEARLTQLDGLGLQEQAVMAMMAVNPARAREMALGMRVPSPPPASCANLAVAILDEYYRLALTIAKRGFTARQREDGEPLKYLLGIISASTSPEQLQGAAFLVRQYGGTEEERGVLLSALASSLKAATANPRAFAATPALAEEMAVLRRQTGDAALEEAWAAYQKTQQKAEPCKDSGNFVFWETGTARELQRTLAKLRPAPAEADAGYEARVMALLHRVEEWREEEDTPAPALFHMKAQMYASLLGQAVTDSLLRAVMASFVQFLRDAPAKTESPAEWMLYFQRMVMPWSPGGMKSVAAAKEEIRRSGDGVMNLLVDAGFAF
jgi:hypothetical protein